MHLQPCPLSHRDPDQHEHCGVELSNSPASYPRVLRQRVTTVIRCREALVARVRYAFDTLLQAIGLEVDYADRPPSAGPWLLYAPAASHQEPLDRCLLIAHDPGAWNAALGHSDLLSWESVHGVPAPPMVDLDREAANAIGFDLPAAAFYFLTSRSERESRISTGSRRLYADSLHASTGLRQDVVDGYLDVLRQHLLRLRGVAPLPLPPPFGGKSFAVALTHDVDFVPTRPLDNLIQGAKTTLRHGVRQRDPASAAKAGWGFVRAMITGSDPYGCVPEIIASESARGVRSSFQVAVARRHPADVNYDIRDDRVRSYLRAITDAGFDLCLHGSYRSTERCEWYVEEVQLLAERLGRPLGSRQHYLSFDYDALFRAQEAAGIRYDMSIGYPDQCGPRAGFSFPYFPYCLEDERPYDVLEIPLFYMDVTLQSYLRLSPSAAWNVLEAGLQELKRKGGAVSVVWHPIVFGGARDPGYDQLYWRLIDRIGELGGIATDARTIHDQWRRRARAYASFADLSA